MKSKFLYALPFLFLFNSPFSKAQFKVESNLKEVNLKNKFFQVAARDTFGLKDLVNIKGIAKLKYDDNSLYFARNGLLNYYYGGEVNINGVNFYYNQSKQNIKNETSTSQSSIIGDISTKTTLLNENKGRGVGIIFNKNNYFVSLENATNNNNLKGQTLIDVAGEKDVSSYEFGVNNETNIVGAGFKYGFFKFIKNRQNKDKFNNYFVKANYTDSEKDFNLYYAKDFAGFLSYNVFDKIDVNLTYDGDFNIILSTSDFSRINKKDFERKLEDKLRIVPRIYDSKLETSRSYLEDMFFTDFYDFSIDKKGVKANLNLNYLLLHYSEDSQKIGLKYKFGLVTYDFKDKEVQLGLFFD
ncbi:hypothetical protein GW931_03090 [archaeon]|nr:hypothetical protein [archaeon]PJC45273.1 MAG: hypothetical protein CO037_02375 [Candidatus Pacearchaeota archaeon CG_4_9_14_0_2_um_filter_30_8]